MEKIAGIINDTVDECMRDKTNVQIRLTNGSVAQVHVTISKIGNDLLMKYLCKSFIKSNMLLWDMNGLI